MSIGRNIRQLRTFYGLSQKEFALIAGVSDKAVSTWESEIKEPRMGVIQKIADHFGLKKSNLIEDDGLNINLLPDPLTDVPQYTPQEIEHLEKYRAITDDHKDAIDHQLDYFFTIDTKSKLDSGLSTAGDC